MSSLVLSFHMPVSVVCMLGLLWWSVNTPHSHSQSPPLPSPRVSFCAEHARRNAMALRAQMRKTSTGPSPEALLAQLSGYSRTDAHGLDTSRSEASRILGEQGGPTSGMMHENDT